MNRRIGATAILTGVLLSSLLPSVAVADTTLPLPASIAAVGDSISQAASSAGSLGVDAPQNSWATGTSSTVNSHYLRLLALGAPISGRNYNLSVSGAKVAGLNAQMQNAVALRPDYLTLLIGGNDVCTDTVAAMTSVADFRAQLLAAMTTLAAGSPSTRVLAVSIPDVYQLWNLFKGNWWARFVWSAGNICQSLLANPTSTQQVDVQRRQQVRQRNIDFNSQLADVCAAFATTCRFDGNAAFNFQFTTSDVAADYFHPSVAGQANLASGTWAAGYSWTASPPPTAPMWVGDLSATTTAGRNGWAATVAILVTGETGPVSGVTVAGSWTGGSGATTCTTNTDGRCSLTRTLTRKTTSVTFAVTGLTRSGWVYDSSRNVLASIVIPKP